MYECIEKSGGDETFQLDLAQKDQLGE